MKVLHLWHSWERLGTGEFGELFEQCSKCLKCRSSLKSIDFSQSFGLSSVHYADCTLEEAWKAIHEEDECHTRKVKANERPEKK